MLQLLFGVVRIFHHIMQQGGGDGLGSKPDFSRYNQSDIKWVCDVGLTRFPAHIFVGIRGNFIRLADEGHVILIPAAGFHGTGEHSVFVPN